MRRLHFGDNLHFMKMLYDAHPEGFIDLIYIDPPFNSQRNYNVLFEEIDMENTKAQKEAFSDTWSSVSYLDQRKDIRPLSEDLFKLLTTLDNIHLPKSYVAYITVMAIRILYIHKLLKDTGSFYLHCDTTMSHYLKLVCDIVFGAHNFQNEITWKRTSAHNDSKRYGRISDVILFYSKSRNFKYNIQYTPYSKDHIANSYSHNDGDGKGNYTRSDLANTKPGGYVYEYKGYLPPPNGWRCPLTTMQKYEEEGRLHFPEKKTQRIRYKRYLNDMQGVPLQEIWTDINPLSSHSKEKLGYPTQKPVELMERIIKASTDEGDIVADFFCGCGTTIAAAHKLNRNWIGCDISHLAIGLIINRLTKPIKDAKNKQELLSSLEISGVPTDVASAKQLAKKSTLKGENNFKGGLDFQDWIIEYELGAISNPKKVGDGGWDGYYVFDYLENGEKKKGKALIEVKSGKVTINMMRAFIHVVNSQAHKGVFVCFDDEINNNIRREAKLAGKVGQWDIDKIQILTVDEILQGHKPKIPGRADNITFKSPTSIYSKYQTERLL